MLNINVARIGFMLESFWSGKEHQPDPNDWFLWQNDKQEMQKQANEEEEIKSAWGSAYETMKAEMEN